MSFNLLPTNKNDTIININMSTMSTHPFGGGSWDPENRRSWLRNNILSEVPGANLLQLLQMSIEQVDQRLLDANTQPVGVMWREWFVDGTIWLLFSRFLMCLLPFEVLALMANYMNRPEL